MYQLNYGYTPFTRDPYGCLPPLSLKRLARNPFARYHPYHASAPELSALLEFCPTAGGLDATEEGIEFQVFEGELPWDHGRKTLG